MKRALVLAVAMAFVLSCVPAFAAQAAKAVKAPASTSEEKTIFQTVADSVNESLKVQPKAVSTAPKGPSVFQELSTSIDEGSAKAKPLTLRGQSSK